jgi:alkylation response protein AidB-like acyl-CoA dehydrogenase
VVGATPATVALTGPSGRIGCDLLDVRATRSGSGWVLDGRAGFVLDAPDAELLVVAARVDDEAALFVVSPDTEGVHVDERLAVDRSRRLADIVIEGAHVDAESRLARADAAVIAEVTSRGGLVVAADACGVGHRALAVSVEYAKQREQFGRPIGSFQAIKHKLADMWVLMEGAEVAVAAAARAVDEGDPRASRLVAIASAYARDAATKVTGDAIQVHGGIGYTWEHVCHRLWKRAKFDECFLGDPSVHRARLARHLLG